jgi:hypothetical protein
MSREAYDHLVVHLPGMRDTLETVIARYASRPRPETDPVGGRATN